MLYLEHHRKSHSERMANCFLMSRQEALATGETVKKFFRYYIAAPRPHWGDANSYYCIGRLVRMFFLSLQNFNFGGFLFDFSLAESRVMPLKKGTPYVRVT